MKVTDIPIAAYRNIRTDYTILGTDEHFPAIADLSLIAILMRKDYKYNTVQRFTPNQVFEMFKQLGPEQVFGEGWPAFKAPRVTGFDFLQITRTEFTDCSSGITAYAIRVANIIKSKSSITNWIIYLWLTFYSRTEGNTEAPSISRSTVFCIHISTRAGSGSYIRSMAKMKWR